MAKLTGTDVLVAARCATPAGVHGAQSARDGLAPAFPDEDGQQGRWLRAVCSDTVPPVALGPAIVVGPRCPRCVLAIAATGTARYRREWPGTDARLLARWRRHPHDQQSPPLARVPDITLAATRVEPVEHEVRAPGVSGSGRATVPGLVSPLPVHHNPRVAR